MGANFGDLDNDGFLDFYIGTGAPDLNTLVPNRMFRNADGRVFQDVTTSGGFGHLQKGHGIAFGDLDNDGDQDIFEVIGGWFTRRHLPERAVSESRPRQPLDHDRPGRHAIESHGARRAPEGRRRDAGARATSIRSARPAAAMASSMQHEIGLGDATSIEAIEVTWPATGTTQVFTNVGMNQFVGIREGDALSDRSSCGLPARSDMVH